MVGRSLKESMLVEHGRQRFKKKLLKQYVLANRKGTTKDMKNKWAETGVHVCDRTVRKRFNEILFFWTAIKCFGIRFNWECSNTKILV